MKRFILVLLLGLVLLGGAFAQHPEGKWGVGLIGQHHNTWGNGWGGYWGYSLSLKAPQLPIFWGVNLRIEDNYFGINLSGDKYLYDELLVKDIGLGWFLGVGGYAGIHSYSGFIDYLLLDLGVRVPIGLSWIPAPFFELFIDVVPSLGIGIGFGDAPDKINFPQGSLGAELGIRFWF
jgi:hypothetical protein